MRQGLYLWRWPLEHPGDWCSPLAPLSRSSQNWFYFFFLLRGNRMVWCGTGDTSKSTHPVDRDVTTSCFPLMAPLPAALTFGHNSCLWWVGWGSVCGWWASSWGPTPVEGSGCLQGCTCGWRPQPTTLVSGHGRTPAAAHLYTQHQFLHCNGSIAEWPSSSLAVPFTKLFL